MASTHAIPDTFVEMQAIWADLGPQVIVSHSGLTVPASSLTMPSVAASGYVLAPGPPAQLKYVSQAAVSIPLAGGNGTYWLALSTDLSTAIAGWTRRAGSHYVWQMNATQPANPAGALVFCQVTVAGGIISAVSPLLPVTSPPMSKQNSNAVAITGGTASLGGHAPTGVLDVQGSVVASDIANQYIGARIWPVAPSGALIVQAVQVQPTTGSGLSTAGFRGINVADQPAGLASAYSLYSGMNAGANRYHIYAAGTAPSYFGGTVQVAGHVGINAVPDPSILLYLAYPGSSVFGIRMYTSTAGAATPMQFLSSTAALVGSIGTTDSGTAYNTTSDVRLKHAIAPLTAALDRVRALRPISHLWNADDSPGEGFLAHELMIPCPLAVSGQPDEVNPDGSVKPQQVDHSKLVPLLTAGLQAALAQIDALTARITTLEEALGL